MAKDQKVPSGIIYFIVSALIFGVQFMMCYSASQIDSPKAAANGPALEVGAIYGMAILGFILLLPAIGMMAFKQSYRASFGFKYGALLNILSILPVPLSLLLPHL